MLNKSNDRELFLTIKMNYLAAELLRIKCSEIEIFYSEKVGICSEISFAYHRIV
jgi:hypothetical protein